MHKRVANLDLFRCIAILAVIYFHVSQRFYFDYYSNKSFIHIGKYGVELFFVLSGFLIGGLYYRYASHVSLVKFWLQRFLRTYPPYLVTLLLSFFAAYKSKHLSFDYGYLFFLQNFYRQLPFFKVSWSLCVEEHFYLLFPFIILLTRGIKNKNVILFFWISLCLLPSIIRLVYGNSTDTTHGYYITATIFRFDGIAVGCLISFVLNNYTIRLKSNNLINIFLSFTLVLLAYLNASSQSVFTYSIGYLILIVNVGMLLISFYFSADFYISKLVVVRSIALMAYSLYLTDALVINISELVINKLKIDNPFFILLLCCLIIFPVGKLFYLLIEKPAIDFRKKVLH